MIKISKIILIISWASLIFVLLASPQANHLYEFALADKIIHFFLFGILTYLIVWIFFDGKRKKFFKIAILAFFIPVFYSFSLEYLQKFIPGRFPDPLDLLAGILGVMTFLYIAYKKYKKPRLLLHICCAPCGAYIGSELKNKYNLTFYYYNPNISGETEWGKRMESVKEASKILKIKLICDHEYNHKSWLEKVKGLENEEEGGERCMICYEHRLEVVTQKAKQKNFDFFATTLTISPYKNTMIINEIGEKLENTHEVMFLKKDFKKNDGFKKAIAVSKILGLYRQNYCGCEFSRK